MGDEPTLYEGDLNVDGWVETLQLALRRAGQDPELIDGKFGWRTAKAVVAFQEANGLTSHNGVVGNETWSALMQRDREPPGVNNPPHGGLNPQPHAGHAPQIHGAGWMPEPAQLTFTSGPAFDGDAITIDLDVLSTGNLAVSVWAELYQNNALVGAEHLVDVINGGRQTIPLGHSYAPGDYQLVVHATDNAGTTIDANEMFTLK